MDKYFLCDPTNYRFKTFKTMSELEQAEKELIEKCMDDGEWLYDIDGIFSGIITRRPKAYNNNYKMKNL